MFFNLLNIYYSNIKKGNWKTLNYFYQNKIACFSNSYCKNHFCYLQTIYWIQSFLLHWNDQLVYKKVFTSNPIHINYLSRASAKTTKVSALQPEKPNIALMGIHTYPILYAYPICLSYMAVLWITVNGWAYQLENGVVYSRSVLAHIIKEHRKLSEIEGVWDPGEDLETSPRQHSWKKSYNKTICYNFGIKSFISDFKIY